MTHRLHHLLLLAAPIALVAFAGCSSDAQRGTTATDLTAVTTTVAPTSTLAPTTTVAPVDTVPETVPPEPEPTNPPIPTIPPQIAPLPEACLAADLDSEPVELVITDNGVLYNGDPVPSCMQVPESFAFRFTNNAEGDATVLFAEGEGQLAPGDSELSDPLGEMFSVGESFQITIVELDTVIEIEVTEAP